MKFHLHLILLTAACILGIVTPHVRANPAITGTFTGNGKPAKLEHVSARKGEPFSGKDTVVVIFTEKDHSKSKRPDFDAGFGKFGSALIITVNTEGTIIGCEVAHSAHKKTPFSSVGRIKTSDFKWANGEVQGKVSTGGESEFFGEKWDVDLAFQAKIP